MEYAELFIKIVDFLLLMHVKFNLANVPFRVFRLTDGIKNNAVPYFSFSNIFSSHLSARSIKIAEDGTTRTLNKANEF